MSVRVSFGDRRSFTDDTLRSNIRRCLNRGCHMGSFQGRGSLLHPNTHQCIVLGGGSVLMLRIVFAQRHVLQTGSVPMVVSDKRAHLRDRAPTALSVLAFMYTEYMRYAEPV